MYGKYTYTTAVHITQTLNERKQQGERNENKSLIVLIEKGKKCRNTRNKSHENYNKSEQPSFCLKLCIRIGCADTFKNIVIPISLMKISTFSFSEH